MLKSIAVSCLALAWLAIGACSPEADTGATGDGDGGRRDDGSVGADAGADADADATPPDVDDDIPDSAGEECGNGFDDNGNGLVDEGCPCLPGTSQSCYPGDPEEIGWGICRAGTQGCDGAGEFGTWTECVGSVTPEPDICGDRLDNDCNGHPDDGLECYCVPAETRPCYTGPPSTRGVPICHDGTQTCDPVAGVGWGDCLDEVLPREEICGNGLDDDCNGAIDDGTACVCLEGTTRDCYSGPASEIGVGVCRAGTQSCITGGTHWTDCSGEVGPTTEVCGDALDNDCDGETDEGCPTVVEVTVDLDGDCVTTRCPPGSPYPVGCDIVMSGGDDRGCVASTPTSPVVYFQEGDRCGAGHVSGRLYCSSEPGTGLDASNCRINKPIPYYPPDRSGCPDTG